VGALSLASANAAAEDGSSTAETRVERADVVLARPTFPIVTLAERLFLRLAAAEVLNLEKLADRAERIAAFVSRDDEAAFDAAARREMKKQEFMRKLEASRQEDETEFDREARRSMKLLEFMRRLEAQQADAEARQFETRVNQFVKKAHFLQTLETRHAARSE
jgi:hypothetical protein